MNKLSFSVGIRGMARKSVAVAFVTLGAFAALAVSANDARAWGQTGHRIVGELAQARLSSKTRAEIRKLIGDESLARASTWPDEVKSDPNQAYYGPFASLHYITIGLGQKPSEMDHPESGDAFTGLVGWEKTLKDPQAAREKKVEALRYLVHVMGDIHMPLHATPLGDQGGNWCYVKFFNEKKNLHALWDEAMIDYLRLSFTEYARFLEETIPHSRRATWARGDFNSWIVETNAESQQVYPKSVGDAPAGARTYCKTTSAGLIEDALMPSLSYDYHYQHRALLEQNLMQGGLRLALTLNRIFDSK